MNERYTVRQASEMTGVKPYVLRYWEDELELRIERNDLGHRYYTGYDIQLFLNIKELKSRGLKLQAIKALLPKLAKAEPGTARSKIKLLEGEATVEECVASGGKILEFQQILERLIAQELKGKNKEEERCRSLDAAIRRQQMARREVAAATERRGKRERRRFMGNK